MKNFIRTSIVLLCTFGSALTATSKPSNTSPDATDSTAQMRISDKLLPIGDENIFRSKDHHNWCGSIIKGKDDKYHLFYSRWERRRGFYAWLTHSTIARATSDRPEGPYVYQNTVIDFEQKVYRKGEHITAHNPKIKCFNGRYYLYFISTNLERNISNKELIETARVGGSHPNWLPLRLAQRTYVSSSKYLDKGWKTPSKSLVKPKGKVISNLAVNPAVCKGHDGRYYLIIKGDKPNDKKFIRHQALAISRYPDKGFRLQRKPVIQGWDSEDMDLTFKSDEARYYALYHAHSYIGMMQSKNGKHWEKAEDNVLLRKHIEHKDNKQDIFPERMERPFLYMEDQQARVLGCATKRGNDTAIITIPLRHSSSEAAKPAK